jgi:drug/metabolite transporter (DMT)-like permease
MIAAYGIANLLQSMAATRTASTDTLDPGLLLRLFGHRTYLLGLGCQIFGFFFALAARRDLPLFLVQASVTAGLCVTALLGVVLLKWRLPIAEIGLLSMVVLGIGALAASAEPTKGSQLGPRGIITLVAALAVIGFTSILRRPHQGRARLGGPRSRSPGSAFPPPPSRRGRSPARIRWRNSC